MERFTIMLLTTLLFSGGSLFWVGLWSGQRVLWIGGGGLLGLVFAWGVGHGSVDPVILPALAGVVALAWTLKTNRCPVGRATGGLCYILIVLTLGFHQFPGLTSFPLMEGSGGVFRFPPEKIILFWIVPPLVLAPIEPIRWRWGIERPERAFALILPTTLLALIPLAILLGHAQPGWTPVPLPDLVYGLAYNLVFVCILEESFFRGILQTALMGWVRHRGWPYADGLSVLGASVLFGVAHLGGGSALVLLATLAGLGYGAIYYMTGRIQYAVLLHFTVNVIQQLAFAALPAAAAQVSPT